MKLKSKSFSFLEQYLNNSSPTSFEYTGQKIWLDYISNYIDDKIIDPYGTVVGVINPQAKYKVVIEAHADEIGWFVNYIDPNGYIYVVKNGGSDHQIAPSMRVNIFGDKGVVKGVFGWPAIHVRDRLKEETPELKKLFIDVGAKDAKEIEKMGIHVGNVITFEDEMQVMNDRYVCARALDNRAGGFMIAEVARMISETKTKLPFGLYVVNSVQEEIGLRGAEMIANRLNPDVAIITDVCHDTQSPVYNKKDSGDNSCGLGPVITRGASVHNLLCDKIIKTAKKNKVPFQRLAASRATGTDTDAFAYSNLGVPSALISLPLKYMHTTVEMVHLDDIQNVIKLIFNALKEIKPGDSYSYI
jgi:tetrahedral aminopeptidase